MMFSSHSGRPHNCCLRSEAICLLPVVLAFYEGDSMPNAHGPTWKSVLLFGGTVYLLAVLKYSSADIMEV